MADSATSAAARKVGFIGLGQMGGAIARKMLGAGVEMFVHDTSAAAADAFALAGATVCGSPMEVADHVPLVFASLPSREISLEVALGERGAIHGSRLQHYVELSTIGKAAVETLAARLGEAGIGVVDCPISGGPKAAEGGTLAIIVAGPPASVAAVRPFLEIVSPKIFVIDERPGQAQVMKLVNNLISAANMAAAFEALVIGAKAGLDPDTMVAVVNAGTGRNTATETKVPQSVLTGTFDYGARLAIMHKDITLGLEEARAAGVPVWTLDAVTRLFTQGMDEGRGDDDYTTLIQSIEQRAGAEVRSRRSNG